MATLWIREYAETGYSQAMRNSRSGNSGEIPVMKEPGTDQTPVTFSTEAKSAAFGADTVYVCCMGSAAFHYLVGSNPTATTNHLKWPADFPLQIAVPAGQKISVVAAA